MMAAVPSSLDSANMEEEEADFQAIKESLGHGVVLGLYGKLMNLVTIKHDDDVCPPPYQENEENHRNSQFMSEKQQTNRWRFWRSEEKSKDSGGQSAIGRLLNYIGQRCVGLTVMMFVLMVPAGGDGGGGGGQQYHAGGGKLRRGPPRQPPRPYERGKAMQAQQAPPCRYLDKWGMKAFIGRLTSLAQHLSGKNLKTFRHFEGVVHSSDKHIIILPPELPSYKMDEHYSKVADLGRGQFGSVVSVVDNTSFVEIARKTVQLSCFERLEHELLCDIGRTSVYVPSLHAIVLENHLVHCFMEKATMTWFQYAQGLIRANEVIDLNGLKFMLHDALQGLLCLHSSNIQHRDIKPQNLALRPVPLAPGDHMSMILDLGAAVSNKQDGEDVSLAETTFYLGPKAARGKCCLKDDVWSLGCAALCMLLRLNPWQHHILPPAERQLKGKDIVLHGGVEEWNTRAMTEEELITYIANYSDEITVYLAAAYEFMLPHWDKQSLDELSFLLCHMLVPDDTERYSVEKALESAFLSDMEDRDDMLKQMFGSPVSSPLPSIQQGGDSHPQLTGWSTVPTLSFGVSIGSSPGSPMQMDDNLTAGGDATDAVLSAIRGNAVSESSGIGM